MNGFMKVFVAVHVWIYRATKGKFGSKMIGGNVLLLTTTGKKTGLARTVPIMYIEDDKGDPIVIASAGGAPQNPAWFNNLVANPAVQVETPGRTVKARAEVLSSEARGRYWPGLVARFPNFGEYEKKCPDRVIPMIVLRPVS